MRSRCCADLRRPNGRDRVHYLQRRHPPHAGPHRAGTAPPRITTTRGPPLWGACDVQMNDAVDVGPDWDDAAQPAPEFEVDQRISWWGWQQWFGQCCKAGCTCRRPKRVVRKNFGQLAQSNHPSRPQYAGLRCSNRVPCLHSCGWIFYPQIIQKFSKFLHSDLEKFHLRGMGNSREFS